jgi:hypothetical protein
MAIDEKLVKKGRGEPRLGLIEEGRYHVGLAREHAAELAENGWSKDKTAALEKNVGTLESAVASQAEERDAARTSTAAEGSAIDDVKAYVHRLRKALPLVLEDSPVEGVSAKGFESGATLGRSTPLLAGYLIKIRPSVVLLDNGFKPYFHGKKASDLLDQVKEALDASDTEQEVKQGGLPEDTATIYEAKGRVLALVERMNRVGQIAFDGQATIAAKFNKDILLRARRERKKAPVAPAPAPATLTP